MSAKQRRIVFHNPKTMPATKGYSQLVEVENGKLFFISGQVSIDPRGNIIGKGDYSLQTKQIFDNIGSALSYVGISFQHLVKINIYLLDISHLEEVRIVRNKYIDIKHPPASSVVQVSALFIPEILLEVEAVAFLPS
jgi:enamine deaminase RidA (YjgF/YER057c/UK114 family)